MSLDALINSQAYRDAKEPQKKAMEDYYLYLESQKQQRVEPTQKIPGGKPPEEKSPERTWGDVFKAALQPENVEATGGALMGGMAGAALVPNPILWPITVPTGAVLGAGGMPTLGKAARELLGASTEGEAAKTYGETFLEPAGREALTQAAGATIAPAVYKALDLATTPAQTIRKIEDFILRPHIGNRPSLWERARNQGIALAGRHVPEAKVRKLAAQGKRSQEFYEFPLEEGKITGTPGIHWTGQQGGISQREQLRALKKAGMQLSRSQISGRGEGLEEVLYPLPVGGGKLQAIHEGQLSQAEKTLRNLAKEELNQSGKSSFFNIPPGDIPEKYGRMFKGQYWDTVGPLREKLGEKFEQAKALVAHMDGPPLNTAKFVEKVLRDAKTSGIKGNIPPTPVGTIIRRFGLDKLPSQFQSGQNPTKTPGGYDTIIKAIDAAQGSTTSDEVKNVLNGLKTAIDDDVASIIAKDPTASRLLAAAKKGYAQKVVPIAGDDVFGKYAGPREIVEKIAQAKAGTTTPFPSPEELLTKRGPDLLRRVLQASGSKENQNAIKEAAFLGYLAKGTEGTTGDDIYNLQLAVDNWSKLPSSVKSIFFPQPNKLKDVEELFSGFNRIAQTNLSSKAKSSLKGHEQWGRMGKTLVQIATSPFLAQAAQTMGAGTSGTIVAGAVPIALPYVAMKWVTNPRLLDLALEGLRTPANTSRSQEIFRLLAEGTMRVLMQESPTSLPIPKEEMKASRLSLANEPAPFPAVEKAVNPSLESFVDRYR